MTQADQSNRRGKLLLHAEEGFCSMLFLSDCMRNKKMCHPGSHLETVKEDGLSQDQHLQGKGAEQIT